MSQCRVSDNVVTKTCWGGAFGVDFWSGHWLHNKKTKWLFLWCICGGCGQTHSVWWEPKIDQSYPLTIWPLYDSRISREARQLHYSINVEEQLVQLDTECNYHLLWWILSKNQQPKSVGVLLKSNKKWSYGYRVDLKKKSFWFIKDSGVCSPPHIPLFSRSLLQCMPFILVRPVVSTPDCIDWTPALHVCPPGGFK